MGSIPTESPCIFLYEDIVKKKDGHQDRRDGSVVSWLAALTDLTKGLDLIPAHTWWLGASVTPVPGNLTPSSGFYEH